MYNRLSREKIEEYATLVLQDYNMDNLIEPRELDVYDFLESYLNLSPDFKNLSKDGSILGVTSFNDGIYYVWDDNRTKAMPIEVEAGTVIIDNSIVGQTFEGRERFTVMHECAHQILHRYYFKKPEYLEKECIVACKKSDIELNTRRNFRKPIEWIEWQANTLAAALLMPAEMFKEAVCRVSIFKNRITVDKIAYELTKIFNVSFISAKIRLFQLGIVY